jgi:hypothetical protein
MKKIIASLTLALAVGMFSQSFASGDPALSTSLEDDNTFQTKVFVRSEGTALDVFVEPTKNTPLIISFRDADGRVLAKEQVSDSKKGVRFDISDLENGSYHVEVTDGDTKQIESLELRSSFQRSVTLQ